MSQFAAPKIDPPPRRTQAERRDESERRLIEATFQIVAEEGVSAATFEAVGRRAGYSRGLAAQKFGSKEGLIRAAIAYLHDRQTAVLEGLAVSAMSGLEALCLYVRLHCAAIVSEKQANAYFMLLADSAADLSPIRTAFAESHEVAKATLGGMIRRGQQGGAIASGIDADATAVMVGAALMGLSIQRLVDPATDIEAAAKRLEATLRRALSPAP